MRPGDNAMRFLTGLIVLLFGVAHAEEIPLKEVRAYNMLGTDDVPKLENELWEQPAPKNACPDLQTTSYFFSRNG